MTEQPQHAPQTPWLTLIGIGEDGVEGLSPVARSILTQAAFVVGGARHLELAAPFVQGKTLAWPTPFERGIDAILARKGLPTVVLASGNPFFFGVGNTLARSIPPQEMLCLPAPSSVALACSRLGWAEQDCRVISLCGRPIEQLYPALQPSGRVIVLSADENTPHVLANWLVSKGLSATRCHVLERLGGPHEALHSFYAHEGAPDKLQRLNLIGLEVGAQSASHTLPLTNGLPDTWFEHDGQLTKREIRAVTLSSLAPRAGELLWDIGGGAGSISIEWMLASPSCRAVCIEAQPERAACIARNAAALGVPGLDVRQARAPEGMEDLPKPDAIFVGGGASRASVLETAWQALKPGGRIVVNAVVAETEARLLRAMQEWGGTLTRISVSRLEKIGSLHGFRPAMPVTQWIAQKPEAS
ncbi:bifunctional cobalt-precorrin-7 (C(5))-methyltransferase/cobalt-precorrin-6B (C(15))-methyltransferase [Acetobacter ascendens]|uniref:Precorrin-6Y C5,15-methyltransferase n=1 Tax=Acetobacter ascendens TaxID=481146 RepID=A0A1D8QVD3_9PROT|nr:bifunctional cobalt-precorrin-7 (C(5))-methyltransferase/cobalt-precorrin-6B (C(15))-methyltransferase [Acetobacter ascendens]AOW46292.1 precorrin-6Y C5,15-methyltransferase [Acetobacter ascendens]AOW49696.1 precorrin-6Y C5,15-methyltransferase [Acetobacter ascendens]